MKCITCDKGVSSLVELMVYLVQNGILAGSIGRIIGVGKGRGIGLMLITMGIMMVAFTFVFCSRKNIREMERCTDGLVYN